jgi:CheY-like chemotaxis protein
VTSTPGHGSTFTIFLPAEPRLAATRELPETAACEGSDRILFVDDEPMVARVAVRALGRLGYRVTPCTSSLEALDRFRMGPDDFDVVITDMTMPAMTGDRLAAAIRAIRPTIPVILCTGFSERMTAEKAMEQGIDGFAYKPVEFSELARMVRRLRDGARPAG